MILKIKVSNGAKIRNRYNQVPHLTQDTNGKVTNSQKTPQTRAKKSNCLNWASRVKQLLSTLGFFAVWVNQGVGNKNVFYVFLNKDYKQIVPKDGQADLQNQAEQTFIHYVLLLNISFTWILLRLKNLELL